MRFKLFEKIPSSDTIVAAGSLVVCVVALAASIWSAANEDDEATMFMLDSYHEQFGTAKRNDDRCYFDFPGSTI